MNKFLHIDNELEKGNDEYAPEEMKRVTALFSFITRTLTYLANRNVRDPSNDAVSRS
jgi:hypothetical protein